MENIYLSTHQRLRDHSEQGQKEREELEMVNDYKKTSCEHREVAPHKNSRHLKDECAQTEQAQP